MKRLHQLIYPEHGHRLAIRDVPEFPETQVFAEAYDLGPYAEEINAIYDEMDSLLIKGHPNPMVSALRARQRTELLKIPLLVDLTTEYVEEENKSVIIFVCFRESLNVLYETLTTKGIPCSRIHGSDSKAQDRRVEEDHQKFLADETRVCICTIQAGGVSMDLDDKHGNYPRISLITPSFSSRELVQALGRPHRATSRSKSLQYILFAADTVEEKACKAVRAKIGNLALLNDGDLSAGLSINTTTESENPDEQ